MTDRLICTLILIFLGSLFCTAKKYYQVKLLKIGAEVQGIDLKKHLDQHVIRQIKSDVTKYQLLVFKNQGVVTGERQVEITKWFGELAQLQERAHHPRQVHPFVLRISNDANEGITGAGRFGWHVDGNSYKAPHTHSIYHIVSVATTGDTKFAPLTEILNSLPQDQYDRWDRLWRISRTKPHHIHPLIYNHPTSHKKVMVLPGNLSWTEQLIWDYAYTYGTTQEQFTDVEETKAILEEINTLFINDNRGLQYTHKWETGDFIISDNLALGHLASSGTQDPRDKVGLRILHRTSAKGTTPPRKDYVDKR